MDTHAIGPQSPKENSTTENQCNAVNYNQCLETNHIEATQSMSQLVARNHTRAVQVNFSEQCPSYGEAFAVLLTLER